LTLVKDAAPTPRVGFPEVVRGASNLRGLSPAHDGTTDLPPDGKKNYTLVVGQRPRNEVPATQVAQGWVFVNAVRRSHPLYGSFSLPLDEPQRGYADPADVVVTPDLRQAFVACAGADTVLALDTSRMLDYFLSTRPGNPPAPSTRAGGEPPPHPRPLAPEAGARGGRTPPAAVYRGGERYALGDLTAGRRYVVARLSTQANPRRLALSGDGKTLVVSNHLADSLTVIDTATRTVVRHIPLGGPAPTPARRGEVLFHSGRMTFQGQFTCASCHPGGGADGLNWDLTRDGVGNFKNTRSLLGVKDTAPYGWEGTSPTLADRVIGTLRTLHQHEPAGTEVADLVAYLRSLPPPRPLPVKGGERGALARGRALFRGKARCAACHHGAALDDARAHDVGTRGPGDTTARFDTPALRGVARTAPYLHDGRAATLEAVFTAHNPRRRHGAAHLLGAEELADLIAYLKSL
jgi:YVTN family beta-propeller protein